jgi:NADH-quinone oxidoreductase subunit H
VISMVFALDFSSLPNFIHPIVSWVLWAIGWLLAQIGVTQGTFFYPLVQFITDPQMVLFVDIIVQTIVVFIFVFLFAGLTVIWLERKLLGRMMDRRGTQVGLIGLGQNFADGIKTLLKAIIIPADADKKVYTWAVVMIIATSALLLGLVPWSDTFYAVNVPLALLLGLAVFSLAPFAILLGGWASNNKYTVIGGMRAAAQLIAYEVPLLLVVVSVVIMTGSMNFNEIVNWQESNILLIVPLIIGAITFFVAGLAEVERVPFDLPEAEAELVEGWQTEYGGFRWGLIMLSDYLRAYIVCALFAILFLGGWSGPGPIPGAIWLLLKTFFLFFIMVWVRAAMVRIRTDQILTIGWRRLLPLAIINLVIVILIKAYAVGGW